MKGTVAFFFSLDWQVAKWVSDGVTASDHCSGLVGQDWAAFVVSGAAQGDGGAKSFWRIDAALSPSWDRHLHCISHCRIVFFFASVMPRLLWLSEWTFLTCVRLHLCNSTVHLFALFILSQATPLLTSFLVVICFASNRFSKGTSLYLILHV